MRYDPETAREELFPDGRYQAEITSAKEDKSKKGYAMLVIGAKVFNGAVHQNLTDYMVTEFAGPMQRSLSAMSPDTVGNSTVSSQL